MENHPVSPTIFDRNYASDPPVRSLLFLLMLIVLCLVVGMLLIAGMAIAQGVGPTEVADLLSNISDRSGRRFFRWTILINHLTMFVLPGLILAWIVYKSSWTDKIGLNRWPGLVNLILGALLMVAAMPLAQFALWLNQQLPLPDWAGQMEASIGSQVAQLLVTESPMELIFNVVVIALVPAIGEELIFRGWLQRNLARSMQQPEMAVWLSAMIFSAFHLQFEGFLARMLLGALLGYLYLWTRNLWVPILAHFANNALQVIAQYLYDEDMSSLDLNTIEVVPWYLVIISLLFTIALAISIYKRNKPAPFIAADSINRPDEET